MNCLCNEFPNASVHAVSVKSFLYLKISIYTKNVAVFIFIFDGLKYYMPDICSNQDDVHCD